MHKKKVIAGILTAALMLGGLSACGKKEEETTEAASAAATTAAATEETPYVEELPSENALDPSNPIPKDTGTLELHEYISPLAQVKMMLPDGTHVEEGEIDSYGDGHVYVYDDAGEWVIEFRPVDTGWADSEVGIRNLNSNPQQDNGTDSKVDWSKEIDGSFAGFPAKFWANNIRGYIADDDQGVPAVVIWMDYGDTISGQWYGLQVRLEAQNPVRDETNIYELLYRRAVRAVLNNFEVIETGEGVEYTGNGFSVTLPARFKVMNEDTLISTVKTSDFSGAVKLWTNPGSDPEAAAAVMGDRTFTRTYGDITWSGVYQEREKKDDDGNPTDPEYTAFFYAPYSDKRIMQVTVNSFAYSVDDYESYFDGEVFTGIMESIKLDPASWQDPTRVSADGFTAGKDGTLQGYDGTDTDIEIPSEIGDVAISTVYGFKDNTSITSVVIPDGVNWIRPDAFRGCTNLKKVVIPASVSIIGNNAFHDCTALETVEFTGDGILEIEGNAFENCPNLKDVTIPDSLVAIESRAFAESGKGSFSAPGVIIGYSAFSGSTFDKISIGSGADLSASWIFYNTKASEIVLGEGVESIGDYAFNSCENLGSLVIPDSVKSFGESAFANVHISGYFYTEIPDGVEMLPRGLFQGTDIPVLIVPASVTKIEEYAIDGTLCYLLNPTVELADNALYCDEVYLNSYSTDQVPVNFAGQGKDFYRFKLPQDANVDETLAFDSFLLANNQSDVTWFGTNPEFIPDDPENYTQDSHYVTAYTGDSENLFIPDYGDNMYDGIWWVKERAFAGNKNIKTVNFGLVIQLDDNILDGCDSLTDIWIPGCLMDSLVNDPDTYISKKAFSGTPENITVHIPDSWSDSEIESAKSVLLGAGLPDSTKFETYSFR